MSYYALNWRNCSPTCFCFIIFQADFMNLIWIKVPFYHWIFLNIYWIKISISFNEINNSLAINNADNFLDILKSHFTKLGSVFFWHVIEIICWCCIFRTRLINFVFQEAICHKLLKFDIKHQKQAARLLPWAEKVHCGSVA